MGSSFSQSLLVSSFRWFYSRTAKGRKKRRVSSREDASWDRQPLTEKTGPPTCAAALVDWRRTRDAGRRAQRRRNTDGCEGLGRCAWLFGTDTVTQAYIGGRIRWRGGSRAEGSEKGLLMLQTLGTRLI